MRISSMFYSLKQGLKNIFRNKMFSLASVATMAACIFIFGLFFSIVTNFQYMVKGVESGVAITVFFNDGVTEDRIKEIGTEIKGRKEVSKINFVSEDEALESFKKDYFKGYEDMADVFTDGNPLAGSSNYEVYVKDVSKQKDLVKYIESIDGVKKVNKSEVVANMLTDFNILIGYVSVAIIIILLSVAVFLISNTVAVGISVRREEIAIMKLIGATDFFVRAPFIVEGILIGIIGSAIPLTAIYFIYNKVIAFVTVKFEILNGILQFLPVNQVYRTLLPAGLLLGIGIGFIGSFLTVRKHLKV